VATLFYKHGAGEDLLSTTDENGEKKTLTIYFELNWPPFGTNVLSKRSHTLKKI